MTCNQFTPLTVGLNMTGLYLTQSKDWVKKVEIRAGMKPD
jgi:hypothetical protein